MRSELRALWAAPAGRSVIAATVAVIVVLLAGLAALWPRGSAAPAGSVPVSLKAEVETIASAPCGGGRGRRCHEATVVLKEGSREGQRVAVPIGTAPTGVGAAVEPGAAIRVYPNGDRFYFQAIDHSSDLLLLVLAFAAVLAAVAGWQGVRALVGLAVSAVLVLAFVIPALREDGSPVLIAVVGASSALVAAALITHGPRLKALLAILCATVLLPVLAGLALIAVELANLAGFAGEISLALTEQLPGLSLSALAIAGMVVAASGALDDVVISQISTTLALPAPGRFRTAMRVGRDHLAAAVNTLILSYAGASLPLLIGFSLSQDWSLALSDELVATALVAMLVGSLGLCVAVPLSTLAASWAADRVPGLALGPVHRHD